MVMFKLILFSFQPFSRGEGAPTYLLFGMPETKVSKKLVLSFIASKGSTFDTVGFVKGKPGGVGR